MEQLMMSPLKWGTITKPGVCLRPQPQAVTEHMMQLGEQMSCYTTTPLGRFGDSTWDWSLLPGPLLRTGGSSWWAPPQPYFSGENLCSATLRSSSGEEETRQCGSVTHLQFIYNNIASIVGNFLAGLPATTSQYGLAFTALFSTGLSPTSHLAPSV